MMDSNFMDFGVDSDSEGEEEGSAAKLECLDR